MTQKERAVQYLKEAYCEKYCAPDNECKRCSVIKKVAETLLEKGVIFPPCKLGDRIYFVEFDSYNGEYIVAERRFEFPYMSLESRLGKDAFLDEVSAKKLRDQLNNFELKMEDCNE